jgi:hypothetical protein
VIFIAIVYFYSVIQDCSLCPLNKGLLLLTENNIELSDKL